MSTTPSNDNTTPWTRWTATVIYRSDAGPLEVKHDIEELYELHPLIELGPSFHAIERIVSLMREFNAHAVAVARQSVTGDLLMQLDARISWLRGIEIVSWLL